MTTHGKIDTPTTPILTSTCLLLCISSELHTTQFLPAIAGFCISYNGKYRPDAAKQSKLTHIQSALFNFHSLLLVLLLLICTSTYVHATMPGPMDRNKSGPLGVFWKCARIGERLSPWVGAACVAMAVSYLIGS